MKKPDSKTLLILSLLAIILAILLSGCSGELEPEKMAERTAIILNQLWEYSTRFFSTLMDNLTCLNGFIVFAISSIALRNHLK